jgi:hypothetical protein
LLFVSFSDAWPWVVLWFLGAYHGINPGMGWLFAVALGMQRQSSRAVWLSLLPIAAGHLLAIGLVAAGAALFGLMVPAQYVRIFVACVLVAFGLYRLVSAKHPRWGGMQVGFRDLTIWSFLMASAHGAGFMLLPLIMRNMEEHHHELHTAVLGASSGAWAATLAVAVHTLGYILTTGAVAFIVYKKVGLEILRKAWVNLDLIWSFALFSAAIVIAM